MKYMKCIEVNKVTEVNEVNKVNRNSQSLRYQELCRHQRRSLHLGWAFLLLNLVALFAKLLTARPSHVIHTGPPPRLQIHRYTRVLGTARSRQRCGAGGEEYGENNLSRGR